MTVPNDIPKSPCARDSSQVRSCFEQGYLLALAGEAMGKGHAQESAADSPTFGDLFGVSQLFPSGLRSGWGQFNNRPVTESVQQVAR